MTCSAWAKCLYLVVAAVHVGICSTLFAVNHPFRFDLRLPMGIVRYDQAPECEYSSSGLNFALHLRMGDRRDIEPVTSEYFLLLEDFMETLTEEVEGKGHASPMFHVFSEALYPCPSPENGTFKEFPRWTVERDQVSRAALRAHRACSIPFLRSGLQASQVLRPQHSAVWPFPREVLNGSCLVCMPPSRRARMVVFQEQH